MPTVVVEEVNVESGTILVRNCDTTLHLGHLFTEAITWKPARTEEELAWPSVVDSSRPVNLRVTKIEAYQHDLGMLDPGWTARLTLEGEGLNELPAAVIRGLR